MSTAERPLLGVTVVAAFNEEAALPAKLENIWPVDLPSERFQLWIGSCVSSDGTNSLLDDGASEQFQAGLYEARPGKISVLNDLIAGFRGSINSTLELPDRMKPKNSGAVTMSSWKSKSGLNPDSNGHYNRSSAAERVDPDMLRRKMVECRSRLAEDPSDLKARIELAWFLLFESLYYRREQEWWSAALSRAETMEGDAVGALQRLRRETLHGIPDHTRLMKECLIQAATVTQLSAHDHERDEAARIREFAEMMGSEQVVAEADAEATRILSRVSRAIFAEKREKTRIASHRRDDDDFDFEDY